MDRQRPHTLDMTRSIQAIIEPEPLSLPQLITRNQFNLAPLELVRNLQTPVLAHRSNPALKYSNRRVAYWSGPVRRDMNRWSTENIRYRAN